MVFKYAILEVQKKQKKIKGGKTMKMYRKMVSKYGKE